MVGKFIGLKRIKGTSKKTGKDFDFSIANIVTEMQERDIDNGAKGEDVHTPIIPERYKDLLCEANIGKNVEVEFYYTNNSENIGYAALAK